MLMRLAGKFLVFVGSAALLCQAQGPVRDPAAVATVQSALARMGVSQNSITSSIVQGTYQSGGASSTSTFIWEFQRSEFRFGADVQSGVLVSGHGKPAISQNGSVTPLPTYVAVATISPLPFLALSNPLANGNYSIQLIGAANVNGRQAVQVRTSLDTDPVTSEVTMQDWYFDSNTGLPLWVSFQRPDLHNAVVGSIGSFSFSNVRNLAGVWLPMQIVAYDGDLATAHLAGMFSIGSLSFNVAIPDSDFDLVGGGN